MDSILGLLVGTWDLIDLIRGSLVCRQWNSAIQERLSHVLTVIRVVAQQSMRYNLVWPDQGHIIAQQDYRDIIALNKVSLGGHSCFARALLDVSLGGTRRLFSCQYFSCALPCSDTTTVDLIDAMLGSDRLSSPRIHSSNALESALETIEVSSLLPWALLDGPSSMVTTDLMMRFPMTAYCVLLTYSHIYIGCCDKLRLLRERLTLQDMQTYDIYRGEWRALALSLGDGNAVIDTVNRQLRHAHHAFPSRPTKLFPFTYGHAAGSGVATHTAALMHNSGTMSVLLHGDTVMHAWVTSCAMQLIAGLIGSTLVVPSVQFCSLTVGFISLPATSVPWSRRESPLVKAYSIAQLAELVVVSWLFGISSPTLMVSSGGPYLLGYDRLYELDRIRLLDLVEALGGRYTTRYEQFEGYACTTYLLWRQHYRYALYYHTLSGGTHIISLQQRFHPSVTEGVALERFRDTLASAARWSVGKKAYIGY